MADEPQPPKTNKDESDASPKPYSGGGQSSEELSSWHRLAGVGVEFIVAFAGCAWLGWWLDKKFATAPWLLITGCAIGFATGLWSLIRAAQKMMK